MNTTSPRTSLTKLGLHLKSRTIKVLVLGQNEVGKTAMIVRFVTQRFIGDYDSNLEKIYACNKIIDNELVYFEILDAAAPYETDSIALENNIKWADAFILLYSVTDKCSFDDCNRLKFLINYNKRRRKLGSNNKDNDADVTVFMVGNKNDQSGERMVTFDEGQRRSRDISCICFHEISVRENVDNIVQDIFHDLYRFWRVFSKFPKLKRSTSDVQSRNNRIISPDGTFYFFEPHSILTNPSNGYSPFLIINENAADLSESTDEMGSNSSCNSKGEIEIPFRSRASTDGTLLSRPRRWRYPPPGCSHSNRVERRMSISTRGSNSSY